MKRHLLHLSLPQRSLPFFGRSSLAGLMSVPAARGSLTSNLRLGGAVLARPGSSGSSLA